MTLSASTVWEVRTAGSDSSGGGFVAGASGTDRSQSDTAFASGTNLTVDNATNTDVTPDGYSPVAADVGNIIQITTTGGGAAFTTGFYQIASIQSGKWRLDRSPAATSSSGASWAMGGALATFSKLASAMVASNKAFVKAGSGYTSTATTTFATTGVNVASTAPPNRLIGYTTTRGDGGQATLTLSTNTGLTGLSFSNNGWYVENIAVNCASLGTSIGITFNGNGNWIYNCKVSNATSRGIFPNQANNLIQFCEVTGCTAAAEAALRFGGNGPNTVTDCNIHDNACPGMLIQSGTVIMFCKITNNTGASSDGIQNGGQQSTIRNNTIYGNGRHGINHSNSTNFYFCTFVRDNLLVSNGGYGQKGPGSGGSPAGPWWDGNAYYNNTSGTRNQLDDTTTNPINGASPYTNTLDVILTASPFTDAAGGDFSLNNTAGGGAAVRGTATPGAMPGVSQVGYMDFGALQAQASAAGGGGKILRSSIIEGLGVL